eukprot:gnl/Chilomastix_cuspidata/3146.p1 GENE.gnl/Chilomastix_cuspidata/3146~~gnl/Chilomastix_cuspidata/3146.p1  ORF type:complete len:616 (+),score=106.91 gnl/Chilomastix_cuspidata/3146:467-2314(+)
MFSPSFRHKHILFDEDEPFELDMSAGKQGSHYSTVIPSLEKLNPNLAPFFCVLKVPVQTNAISSEFVLFFKLSTILVYENDAEQRWTFSHKLSLMSVAVCVALVSNLGHVCVGTDDGTLLLICPASRQMTELQGRGPRPVSVQRLHERNSVVVAFETGILRTWSSSGRDTGHSVSLSVPLRSTLAFCTPGDPGLTVILLCTDGSVERVDLSETLEVRGRARISFAPSVSAMALSGTLCGPAAAAPAWCILRSDSVIEVFSGAAKATELSLSEMLPMYQRTAELADDPRNRCSLFFDALDRLWLWEPLLHTLCLFRVNALTRTRFAVQRARRPFFLLAFSILEQGVAPVGASCTRGRAEVVTLGAGSAELLTFEKATRAFENLTILIPPERSPSASDHSSPDDSAPRGRLPGADPARAPTQTTTSCILRNATESLKAVLGAQEAVRAQTHALCSAACELRTAMLRGRAPQGSARSHVLCAQFSEFVEALMRASSAFEEQKLDKKIIQSFNALENLATAIGGAPDAPVLSVTCISEPESAPSTSSAVNAALRNLAPPLSISTPRECRQSNYSRTLLQPQAAFWVWDPMICFDHPYETDILINSSETLFLARLQGKVG